MSLRKADCYHFYGFPDSAMANPFNRNHFVLCDYSAGQLCKATLHNWGQHELHPKLRTGCNSCCPARQLPVQKSTRSRQLGAFLDSGQAANFSSRRRRSIRRPIHWMTGTDMLFPSALYLGPPAGVGRSR